MQLSKSENRHKLCLIKTWWAERRRGFVWIINIVGLHVSRVMDKRLEPCVTVGSRCASCRPCAGIKSLHEAWRPPLSACRQCRHQGSAACGTQAWPLRSSPAESHVARDASFLSSCKYRWEETAALQWNDTGITRSSFLQPSSLQTSHDSEPTTAPVSLTSGDAEMLCGLIHAGSYHPAICTLKSANVPSWCCCCLGSLLFCVSLQRILEIWRPAKEHLITNKFTVYRHCVFRMWF